MSGRSIRAWREQRRYERAMRNIRQWMNIPDSVSDDEINQRIGEFGRAAARSGRTIDEMQVAMDSLARVAQRPRP